MNNTPVTNSDFLNGIESRKLQVSDGFSLSSQMDNEIAEENLAENTIKADTEYNVSGLQSQGIAREDYDFPSIAGAGKSIADSETGVRLDNEFINPARMEVAGRDLATGDRYRSPLVDSEGYADQGFSLLRDSYKDPVSGRPAEDAYPLGYIGYQAMLEGNSYDQFVKMVPNDWPEENKKAAWATANRVQDRINFEEYVAENEPPEYEAPEMEPVTVDSLPTNKQWMDSISVIATKMGSIDKYENPEQLNDYGLNMLSTFNWNITAMAGIAARVMSSDDQELKNAWYTAMTIYENTEIDLTSMEGLEFTGRAIRGMATDPVTWASGGLASLTFKGVMKAYGTRMGSKYFAPILAGAGAGMVEEGIREASINTMKQGMAVSAGAQDEIDAGKVATDTGKAMAIGAVGGAGLDIAARGAMAGGSKVMSRMKEISNDPNFFNSPVAGGKSSQRGSIGDLLGEPRKVKPFYSRMQETVEAKLPPKGGTGRVLSQTINAWARKGQDFKAEELKWSGLDDYLTENADKKFTREDISNWLEDNNVQIEVKKLGEGSDEMEMVSVANTNRSAIDDPDYVASTAEDIAYDITETETGFEYYDDKSNAGESLEDFSMRIAQAQYDDSPFYEATDSVYGYTWSGNDDIGWNVKDPEGVSIGDVVYDEPRIQEMINTDVIEQGIWRSSEEVPEGFDGITEFHDYRVEGGENYRETLFKYKPKEGEDFTTGHYSDDNVLVHSRVSDFETTDGNSTMFLDEVQSDWHKKGEEAGYKSLEDNVNKMGDLLDERKLVRNKLEGIDNRMEKLNEDALLLRAKHKDEPLAKWKDKSDIEKARAIQKESQDINTEQRELLDKEKELTTELAKPDRSVADAPLKKGKSVELAMRSNLREAAMEGKDSLSWSTAQVHEDRWGGEHGGVFKNQYDKAMVKYGNKLAKKFGSHVKKSQIEDESGELIDVWEIPITDQMRQTAKKKGVELFQFGAGVSAAGAASQQMQGENNGSEFK